MSLFSRKIKKNGTGKVEEGNIVKNQPNENMIFHASLLNSINQAVVATDTKGIVTYWNQGAEKIFGWSAIEITGKSLFDLILKPECSYRSVEIFDEIKNSNTWAGELFVNLKDNNPLYIYFTCSPLLDKDNNAIGLVGISFDISERKKTENKLNESIHRFSNAIDNFPYEFIVLDPNFNITYANKLAVLNSLPPIENLIGKNLMETDSSQLAEHCQGMKERLFETRKVITKSIETGEEDKKNHLKVMYIPVLNENEEIKEIFRIIIDLTNIRKTENQLRALSNQMEKLREEERHRISREIHDELGQIFTVLKIDLVGLQKRPPEKEKLPANLEPIIALVDSGVESARRLSFELRPGILDQMGLIPALEWLISEYQRRTDILFEVDFPKEMPPRDTDKSVAVYRIFQEIITNIIRHAKASKVIISLNTVDGALNLSVKDNGIGFEFNSSSESLGLLGMQERAKNHLGTLRVETKSEAGTTVFLSIPNDIG